MRRLLLLRQIAVPVVAALFVVAAKAATAVSQTSGHRRVQIAVPDHFPVPDARALVVRYGSATRPDVIVLNLKDANAEALAAALALLRRLDTDRPRSPGRYVVATLKGFAPLGRPDAATLRELASQIATLLAQPRSRIGNLGPGRWIEVHRRHARS